MANDKRGEVAIELDGKPYVMRFTLGSIRRLELRFGKSIAAYLKEKGDGLDAESIVAIFDAGISDLDEDQLYDMMEMPKLGYYVECMTRALTGGPAPKPDTEADPRPLSKAEPTQGTGTIGMN